MFPQTLWYRPDQTDDDAKNTLGFWRSKHSVSTSLCRFSDM